MGVPASDASYSASIIAGSTSAFIFMHDAPVATESRLTADPLTDRLRASRSARPGAGGTAGPGVPGEGVEELGEVGADVGVGGEQPDVLVEVRGHRVVVAGADVAVAPDPGAFLAHDEQDLGVGLQPDEAVHDVDAGLFELAGPFDVGLLVEAGLELDERDDLLARLRGPDQRLDDRALRPPVR